MSRNWTAAQTSAIETKNKTLLVSAAAGSGKTATLTERIIRKITDKEAPADISKMLIVTFTRAAAAELKARIFSALNDELAKNPSDKTISSQLLKLGSANISTIDSFYFDLVQANASVLGISSKIRIADDAEYYLLAQAAMNKAIDNLYECNENFSSFAECFANIRQTNSLPEIFISLHGKLSALPEGIEFIRECAERTEKEKDLDFFATTYGQILSENSLEIFEHFKKGLEEAVEFAQGDEKVNSAYGAQFKYDLDVCNKLCDAVNNKEFGYSNVRNILMSYSPENLGTLRKPHASERSALYRDLRSEFKKNVEDLRSKAFSKSAEMISRAMGDTAKHIHTLYALLSEFEALAQEEKSRMGILTFTDIRRLTLSLLLSKDGTPTETAKKYAEQFSEIYIDEYQDVDRVQDLIFTLLSKENNRFMVGDIKQSIYSFRGSEPQLFADYRSRFPAISSSEAESSEGLSIFMSDNFRCDENVINFTNLVCSKLFSVSGGMDYTEKDDLSFAKAKPFEEYISSKVEISVVKVPSRSNRGDITLSDREIEAEHIANKIEYLLKNGKKADGSPILPGDIAVLYRSKRISPIISAALKKRGILSTDADAEKYFENPDVLMLLCILNAVDNPHRDIYTAGALRSPIFGFTMNDLINIRSSYDESYSLFSALLSYADDNENELSKKCKDFSQALALWQELSVSLPIDKFLKMLFETEKFMSTGLVSQVKEDGDGGNLLMLYEFARGFERNGFKGLYQFIEYINSMINEGKSFDIGEQGMSKDRVSLMTMHKSKGLEFPVCFICEADKSIRSKDSKDSLVFKYPFGIAMKLSDKSGFARMNTPLREALISAIATKQAEEEMRILYVALTRAREQLYISCTTSKKEDAIFDEAATNVNFFDRHTVINGCSSYLDWIMLSCTDKCGVSFEFRFVEAKDVLEKKLAPIQDTEAITFSENEKLTRMLKEKFAFKYPYKKLSTIPSKLSVSRLYPDILDQNDESLELFTENKKADIPSFFMPNSVKKATSAERGTATHLFLQFCDFEFAAKHGIEEELSRLEHKRFLPGNARELIYKDELSAFLESELLRKLLDAKEIIREQRFNVELPANDFTSDSELLKKMQDEALAVQGVIDLILIDKSGNVTLVDYKTDRLSFAELNNTSLAKYKLNKAHGLQLSYYAKAVELLFGKPCTNVFVYSTHSSQLYEIDISYDKNVLTELYRN